MTGENTRTWTARLSPCLAGPVDHDNPHRPWIPGTGGGASLLSRDISDWEDGVWRTCVCNLAEMMPC